MRSSRLKKNTRQEKILSCLDLGRRHDYYSYIILQVEYLVRRIGRNRKREANLASVRAGRRTELNPGAPAPALEWMLGFGRRGSARGRAMSHQPCPCPRVRRRRRRWRGGARSGARGQAGEAGARVYMREAGGGWGGRKSCAARQCQLQTWKGWVRSIKLEVARPSQEGRHHPSQAKGKLETTARERGGEEVEWKRDATQPTNQPTTWAGAAVRCRCRCRPSVPPSDPYTAPGLDSLGQGKKRAWWSLCLCCFSLKKIFVVADLFFFERKILLNGW